MKTSDLLGRINERFAFIRGEIVMQFLAWVGNKK